MTLWEFMAARDGFALENGMKPKGGDISEERLSELGIAGF